MFVEKMIRKIKILPYLQVLYCNFQKLLLTKLYKRYFFNNYVYIRKDLNHKFNIKMIPSN